MHPDSVVAMVSTKSQKSFVVAAAAAVVVPSGFVVPDTYCYY